MAAYNTLLYLRSAKRGASGTTPMLGARRAIINFNLNQVSSRGGGDELPHNLFVTGADPEVVIETENYKDVIDAVTTAGTEETLALAVKDDGGDFTITCKIAKLKRTETVEAPPREQGGRAIVHRLVFGIVMGAADTVTSLAQAFVRAAG